jgi:hypothetical protein
MSAQKQIAVMIDVEIHDRLQQLMVPPVSDISSVIESLLYQRGRRNSPAAIAVAASEHHFSYEEELERARMGVYDGCGAT